MSTYLNFAYIETLTLNIKLDKTAFNIMVLNEGQRQIDKVNQMIIVSMLMGIMFRGLITAMIETNNYCNPMPRLCATLLPVHTQ